MCARRLRRYRRNDRHRLRLAHTKEGGKYENNGRKNAFNIPLVVTRTWSSRTPEGDNKKPGCPQGVAQSPTNAGLPSRRVSRCPARDLTYCQVMGDAESLFPVLRRTAEPGAVAAIAELVANGSDRDLNRVNTLAFARKHDLDTEHVTAAFLHASRIGLFEMQWNVLCPGCGGFLDANASLKTIHQDIYNCSLCLAGYEPTLDEMVDVNFTVSRRVRKIAAHDPEALTPIEYWRQIFWSTSLDLPDDLDARFEGFTLEFLELPAGEKAVVSVLLPAAKIVVFEPVSHAAHFIHVSGEPVTERRNLSIIYNQLSAPTGSEEMAPGPVRIAFDNQNNKRALPSILIMGEKIY